MRHDLEYKALPARELRADETGGELEGLAACFFNVDESFWPDILAPGCFAQDPPEFLAEGFVSGLNHDWDTPIGKPLEARETADGLFVRASISDTQAGRDVRTLLRDGVVKRLSIGFRVLGKSFLETADEVSAWWQSAGYSPTPEDLAKAGGGVRLVTRVRLYEFGPVAVPANRRAVVTGVKERPRDGETEGRSGFDELSREVVEATSAWAGRLREGLELRGALPEERLAELKRVRDVVDRLVRDAEPARRAGAGEAFAEYLALCVRGVEALRR